MRKRLCQAQLKQWHRPINPVLFAYREVPQKSTGFSPFQLLYGRLVRGPGTILRAYGPNIPEVKSSYEYITELRELLEHLLKRTESIPVPLRTFSQRTRNDPTRITDQGSGYSRG